MRPVAAGTTFRRKLALWPGSDGDQGWPGW